MRGGKDKLKGSPLKGKEKMKGGLLVRYLWTQGKDSIHDMCVVNTDAAYYQSKNTEKCLETAKKDKKKNYLDACPKQGWHLTTSVASVDGLLGFETEATLKRIDSRLKTEWKEPYSRTSGCMKSRFAITLIRSPHRCMWGSRVLSSQIGVKRLQW